jgi:hypothetical protein
MPKRDRASYMRNYRRKKPQASKGQSILRDAWKTGAAEIKIPLFVTFDGRTFTADFPGAFGHTLQILGQHRTKGRDGNGAIIKHELHWMFDLFCNAVFGEKWPPAAHRMGIPQKHPPLPRLSLDELRSLIFGGVEITEEDYARAKAVSDMVRLRRKGERPVLKWSKSQLDRYFASQPITQERYLDWRRRKRK